MRLPLGNASFLSSFRQCAPQIRFLFICQHSCNNRDPWTLIAQCQNLAHLCIISESKFLRPPKFFAVIPTMSLLSFTTSVYCLIAERTLLDVNKCKSEYGAVRNARLHVVPDISRLNRCEQKTWKEILATAPEWKLQPTLDIGKNNLTHDHLLYWEQLRLEFSQPHYLAVERKSWRRATGIFFLLT